MPQDSTLFHACGSSTNEMQVRSADCAGCNANDRIRRFLQLRFGNGLQRNFANSAKNNSFHKLFPPARLGTLHRVQQDNVLASVEAERTLLRTASIVCGCKNPCAFWYAEVDAGIYALISCENAEKTIGLPRHPILP